MRIVGDWIRHEMTFLAGSNSMCVTNINFPNFIILILSLVILPFREKSF